MHAPLKILLLEDAPDDIVLIERELEKSELLFFSLAVKSRSEFERALTEFKPDVILSDHSLPQFSSIEAFELFKAYKEQRGVLIPFILVTGNVSEEFAVQSIKAGVDDYILKDRLKRLPLAIESALKKCRMEKERLDYIRQLIAKEALMNEAEQLANFGSWQADLRTGVLVWSDATYSIYGYRPGEIEPNFERFMSHVHPDDRVALKELILQLREKHDKGEYEFRIIAKNGAVKYLSCKMQIQRDADGNAIRTVGFNLDVTERKLAEVGGMVER